MGVLTGSSKTLSTSKLTHRTLDGITTLPTVAACLISMLIQSPTSHKEQNNWQHIDSKNKSDVTSNLMQLNDR